MVSAQNAEWGRSTSRGSRGGKYRWRNSWSKRELGPKGVRGPKGGRARAQSMPWDDNRPVPRRENGRGRMVQRPEACERVSPVSRDTMPGRGGRKLEKNPTRKRDYLQEHTRAPFRSHPKSSTTLKRKKKHRPAKDRYPLRYCNEIAHVKINPWRGSPATKGVQQR